MDARQERNHVDHSQAIVDQVTFLRFKEGHVQFGLCAHERNRGYQPHHPGNAQLVGIIAQLRKRQPGAPICRS